MLPKTGPLVTIVIPTFNSAGTIETALRSAIDQTLEQLEIIVVDDCSSDDTVAICTRIAEGDDRVSVITQPENRSAFQARRVGVFAAAAPYIMFLDGDDSLRGQAAAKAVSLIEKGRADLAQFGVVLERQGVEQGGRFAQRLQPVHARLDGEDVGLSLFSAGALAGGSLWRYIYRAELLRDAYGRLPSDAVMYRCNDLPVAFLAAMLARSYVSMPDKLYHYKFGDGRSGEAVTTMEDFEFFLSGLESVEAIGSAVEEMAYEHGSPQALLDSYDNARLTVIFNVLQYLVASSDVGMKRTALALVESRAGRADVVRAAARFRKELLGELAPLMASRYTSERPGGVLLATHSLQTGGVANVMLSQARDLIDSGVNVTIVARGSGSDLSLVPDGVAFYEVAGRNLGDRLDQWTRICEAEQIGTVVDHRAFYSPDWHYFAMMSRALDVNTIAYLHSFAGRPFLDLTDRVSLIVGCRELISQLVVLSPLDVAFWRLQGIERTVWLPNPASATLSEFGVRESPREAPRGRRELIWLGRLDHKTKQVLDLLDVAASLRTRGVDFRLTVVGPEWKDLTPGRFNEIAAKRGLGEVVQAIGARHGRELIELLDGADAFVGTSVIEGYPLTLVEAQARGLPVFMYELPWLATARGDGIVTVPQGDAKALAAQIAISLDSLDRYSALTRGATANARDALRHDFPSLWLQLLRQELPAEFSPQPTVEDAAFLIRILTGMSERNAGLPGDLESTNARLKRTQVQLKRTQVLLKKTRPALPVTALSSPIQDDGQSAGRLHDLRSRLARIKRVLASGPRRLEATEATIKGGTLSVRLRLGREGLPSRIAFVREVGCEVTEHIAPYRAQGKGAIAASVEHAHLGDRRWRIQATYETPRGPVTSVIPIGVTTVCSSDNSYRVRTFDGATLQVVHDL